MGARSPMHCVTDGLAGPSRRSFAQTDHGRRRGRVLRGADLQARLPRRRRHQACARPTASPTRRHLGQFRASGEPYITHPIAVAGLCAEWKLDVQAIMAALMHDAMEDRGIAKAELIERFGAPPPTSSTASPSSTSCASRRARNPGRVLPQDAAGDGARRARHPHQAGRPAAQHAHHGGDDAGQARAHRRRDAGDLRADRAPPRPQPDLPRAAGASSFRHLRPVAPCGAVESGAEGARLPARRGRASSATWRRPSQARSCRCRSTAARRRCSRSTRR